MPDHLSSRNLQSTLRSRSIIGAAGTIALGGTGALIALLAAGATPASAVATLTVDTSVDAVANSSDCTTPVIGSCSLRDALAAAVDGDTIEFDATVFPASDSTTITLTQGQLSITDVITINGPSASALTVDAAGASRVFYATNAVAGDIVISGITAANGSTGGAGGAFRFDSTQAVTLTDVAAISSSGMGGGIVFNNGGAITMVDCTVDGNTSSTWGGGIYTNGSAQTIVITDSTISNNHADTDAYASGGGILFNGNDDVVTISNSTITGNTAKFGGAGIYLGPHSDLTINQSTISQNTAIGYGRRGGGGIVLGTDYYAPTDLSTVTISGSIVSGNTDTHMPGFADFFMYFNNTTVAMDSTSSIIGEFSSNLSVNDLGGTIRSNAPGLTALADNGGRTLTMALASDSIAIDAGPDPVATFSGNQFDQRGIGYDRVEGAAADIGAFEVQAAPEPTTSTSTSTTSPSTTTTTTTEGTDPVVPAFTG